MKAVFDESVFYLSASLSFFCFDLSLVFDFWSTGCQTLTTAKVTKSPGCDLLWPIPTSCFGQFYFG